MEHIDPDAAAEEKPVVELESMGGLNGNAAVGVCSESHSVTYMGKSAVASVKILSILLCHAIRWFHSICRRNHYRQRHCKQSN